MRILSAISLILGCFLGAGFISGREVACYFSRFGSVGYIACIVSGILFFLLVAFFFVISTRVRSTEEFICCYFAKSKSIVEWLFAICILIITGSMFAGTSALASSLKLSEFLVVSITIALTFGVVCRNVKGLECVNVFLVPILILILILTMKRGVISEVNNGSLWDSIISGGGYVFINIISLGLLIIEIGYKYSKREKLLITLICSLVITGLLIGVNFSIISNGLVDNIMPNLELSSRNFFLYTAMQISIYLGLFTTLISNVFLLSNFVNKYIKNKVFSVVVSIVLGVVISLLGFDNLVGNVYIFIAVVGLIVVIFALKKNRNFVC